MQATGGEDVTGVLVGRKRELEQVKLALTDPHPHVLLLHGPALVGKRCLLLQAVKEVRLKREQSGQGENHVITVDCSTASNWPAVQLAICQALGLDEKNVDEKMLDYALRRRFESSRVSSRGRGTRLMVLLRVNGLACTGSDVDSLSHYALSLTSAGVTTAVTSRRRLKLLRCQEVPPLTLEDALQLLSHHAPGVNVKDYSDLVERHCQGLPPLVNRLAELVRGQSPFLSSVELAQNLAKDQALLVKGLETECDTLFQSTSPEVRNRVTEIVTLVGGRFSEDVLQAMMGDGEDSTPTKIVVQRLCDEGLAINTTSKQVWVQPLLVHHVQRMQHVDVDDQARYRVITFLGRVLSQAESKLYLPNLNTVHGYLPGDWPNLEHLLRQAIHCTSNTYPAFLQVAEGAGRLLVKCCPEEALQFFKDMEEVSTAFARPQDQRNDQAVLQGLIGMAIMQGKDTGWEDALINFGSALNYVRPTLNTFDNTRDVLQGQRLSVLLLQLLCNTGIVNLRLSRHQEADRYLKEALETSEKIKSEDTGFEERRQLDFLAVRICHFLALNDMYRGHLNESKKRALQAVKMCPQGHPDLPVLTNSIGLIFERSGESQDLALKYYRQSLAERRQYASVAESDLVPTLNNVGMQYCRRRNFDLAKTHLEDAAKIRARHGRLNYYTALTQQHLGQGNWVAAGTVKVLEVVLTLDRVGDFRQALDHLQEAEYVYSRCTPGHDVRCQVALCLAHVYLTGPCRNVGETCKQLQQVQELAARSGDDLSDSALLVLLSAVEHAVQLLGWRSLAARPLLDAITQRFNRFDGDSSQQFLEHRSILDAAKTLANPQSEISPDQNDGLRARVLGSCLKCQTLADSGVDVPALWREAEQKVQGCKEMQDSL